MNLKNINYYYPNGSFVFKNLNFKLNSDDRIGLLAPNGSGKTTLFHIIMGLIKPISGTIKIFGKLRNCEKDFIEVRKRIGLLFQNSDDQLFCPTVLDDVAFGPLNLNQSTDEAISIARSILKFLGILHLEERVTHRLSGGEKKIVSIATILSMNPEILLLDEPSSGLDIKNKDRIINILCDLNRTCIIVSHELDLLSKTTKNIFTIENGKIFCV
jgi:cobalt/nickel transport system ATP-binding protein